MGLKIHVRQDVLFDIDSRGHLNQFQAFRREAEDAAFGYITHRLAAQAGVFAAESSMFHFVHELSRTALLEDLQFAVGKPELQTARREGAAKDQALGILADIDEPSGARQPGAEFAHVETALAIRLCQAKEGKVKSAAIVKIKLVGLIDDGVGVDRGAKVQPSGRNSADHSGLGGEGNEIGDLLLVGHIGHAFGHADSQVDHAVGLQLHRRPARNHLARR